MPDGFWLSNFTVIIVLPVTCIGCMARADVKINSHLSILFTSNCHCGLILYWNIFYFVNRCDKGSAPVNFIGVEPTNNLGRHGVDGQERVHHQQSYKNREA